MSRNKRVSERAKVILLVALISLPIYFVMLGGFGATSHAASSETQKIGQPTLGADELLNSTIAQRYGIKGVIILNRENGDNSTIDVVQGVGKEVIITAMFISYDPTITETYLKLDSNDNSIVIERGLGNGKGTIKLNDFVKFEETSVRLPANKIAKFKLVINVPSGTTHTSILLGPVGISSEYPIISNMRGYVDV